MDNNGNSYDFGDYGRDRSSSDQLPVNQADSEYSSSSGSNPGSSSSSGYPYGANDSSTSSSYSYGNRGDDPYARGGSDPYSSGNRYSSDPYSSGNYNYAAGRYENRSYNYDGRGEVPRNYMSMTDWVITLIIGIIPFVNFIMLLIWSFGGSAPIEKQRYARASLIILIIFIILMTIFTASLLPAFMESLQELESIQSF